jgi:predicted component of type VI protein secretion system
MPAQLLALTDGPNILLDKPILLLGRHPECDIQIESRKISRRHCCIAQVHDYLLIRDLGSTNGIRINGIRVQEGKLKPDDEVTIGNSRYKVTGESILARVAHPADKPAVPMARAEVIDDAVLESCEEPVALEEPESPIPPAIPIALLPQKGADAESFILPEQLELAPLSDIIRPQNAG